MTLPRQQGKRLGLLLVELSYELSRRSGIVGSPERPLSTKGREIYTSFWISRVWHFLDEVLRELPLHPPTGETSRQTDESTAQVHRQIQGRL